MRNAPPRSDDWDYGFPTFATGQCWTAERELTTREQAILERKSKLPFGFQVPDVIPPKPRATRPFTVIA